MAGQLGRQGDTGASGPRGPPAVALGGTYVHVHLISPCGSHSQLSLFSIKFGFKVWKEAEANAKVVNQLVEPVIEAAVASETESHCEVITDADGGRGVKCYSRVCLSESKMNDPKVVFKLGVWNDHGISYKLHGL